MTHLTQMTALTVQNFVSAGAGVAVAVAVIRGFARQQFDRIADDSSVKAIVLRVDSPGGTVAGSDELHHRLATLAATMWFPFLPLFLQEVGAKGEADALFWVAVGMTAQGIGRLRQVA